MEKSSHFRSPDPIQNLRLKVTLSRLSGPRKLKNQTSTDHTDQVSQQAEKGEASKEKSDADKENQEEKDGNEGPPDEETGRKTKRQSRRRRKGKDGDGDQEEEEKPADHANGLVPPTTDEDELTAEFAWQQKVFSRQEVTRYAHADESATMLERKYREQMKEDGVTMGHTLFTYVHSDDFNAEHEVHRTVSTSTGERMQHLVRRLLGKTANPTMSRLMQFQAMSIMAEIEGETDAGDDAEEKVLVAIKAYPNGSFDIRPSFTADGETHRFQTLSGAVYEYTVHNVQEPSKAMVVKQKKAADTATDRAARLRSALLGGSAFVPPPGPSPFAVRVTVLLEIVAARGFEYDSLYVEYAVKTGSAEWNVTSGQSQLTGVTQVTKCTRYEADATSTAQQDSPCGLNTHVAHFGFPVELELEAQHSPEPSQWPTVYFQVASYDQWDRYRTQGYCYLDVDPSQVGSRTHYLRAWKPTGTVTERMHTFFTGGAAELEELSLAKKPAGSARAALNKYGFSTDTTGELKVRVNMLVQQQTLEPRRPAAHKPRRVHAQLASTPATPASSASHRKGHRDMAAVVERAQLRLAAARGEAPDSPTAIKEAATLR